MTASRPAALLALAVIATALFIGGAAGALYLAAFVAATAPGWSLGRVLFGPRHPAAWIAGSLLGYGITALALWLPIYFQVASAATLCASWLLVLLACRVLGGRLQARGPLVPLPDWDRGASIALVCVLLLAPALLSLPDAHIGQTDGEGGRRYRAYFTADFVWHEALTAELARFSSPPRNPYLAAEPLHYYWAYFLLPASITGATAARGDSPPIESYLAVNALCAGTLFLGAVFLSAWSAVPRPWAAATAVALVVLAASAEGAYSVIDLLRRDAPLTLLRGLNIDAITSWFFGGLTIDGLPRALWYGPQHANASALGLIGLTIASRSGRAMPVPAALLAGLCFGLGLMMSPFTAGVMVVVYALVVIWDALAAPRELPRVILVQCAAGAVVAAALGWCLLNGTFEGAGGAVEIALSRAATRRAATILGLALGPVLVPSLAALGILAARRFPRESRHAVLGVAVAAFLFFFVTLVLEPIWVGWRAGQLFLVSAPALVATTLLVLRRSAGMRATAGLVVLIAVIGLPTTLIDFYNAQDTTNLDMGPGFRWTVRLTPGEREALTWIETRTPSTALVQMSLNPRGRETWSLIPSFARRRMAAGLPISLLRTPEYEAAAAAVDEIFATADAETAAQRARSLGIDYLYVGDAERRAFAGGTEKFADRQDLFGTVFSNGDVQLYVVF